MTNWIGLDIGGANIKLATSGSIARSVAFPLWQRPQDLCQQLKLLLAELVPDSGFAVTMTGELADCFDSRSAGVAHIVDAVSEIADDRVVKFYCTDGDWLDVADAKKNWLLVAAANWHAIASLAGQFLDTGNGFLIDIGSTTTDIIPIRDGKPAASGKTDFERLRCSELFYAGVQRTAVCSLRQHFEFDGQRVHAAREFFATIEDVFLVLGQTPDTPENCSTADGRPATRAHAARRLARMVCQDAELMSSSYLQQMAQQTLQSLMDGLTASLHKVMNDNSDLPLQFVASGQGEWLAKRIIEQATPRQACSHKEFSTLIGPENSKAAGAYAVAVLAGEATSSGSHDDSRKFHDNKIRNKSIAPIRIVKIGGSLIDWEHTPIQIDQWLVRQPPKFNVWVTGGGKMVDYVREWNIQTPLGEQHAHWLCIDLMSVTTRLAIAWFPSWRCTNSFEDLKLNHAPDNCLFDSAQWLRTRSDFPTSWHVTSDSIAAYLATHLSACELVLLKSCGCPSDTDLQELSDLKIVDSAFSKIAAEIPTIRLVNLRHDNFAESTIERFSTGHNPLVSKHP